MRAILLTLMSLFVASPALSAPKRVMVYPVKNLAKAKPSALLTLRNRMRIVAGEVLSQKSFYLVEEANLTDVTKGKTTAASSAAALSLASAAQGISHA